jgi:hypothetical protein
MAKQLYVNSPAVAPTLAATIAAGDTGVTLSDASFVPAVGNVTALIESELVLITARTGNVLTIARAQEGTAAAAHAAGVPMYFPLTDAALRSLGVQALNGVQATTRRGVNLIAANGVQAAVADNAANDWSDITLTETLIGGGLIYPPSALTWMWANQGSAARKASGSGIVIESPPSTTDTVNVLYRPMPTPPFTVTALIHGLMPNDAYPNCGLVLHNTTTGAAQTFGLSKDGSTIRFKNWPALAGSSSDAFTINMLSHIFQPLWLQVSDDGSTNRTYRIAIDGVNFVQVYQAARTSYLTPNAVGFYVDPRISATGFFNCQVRCLSWKES